MNSPEPAQLVALGRGGLRANLGFAGLVLVLLPVLVGAGLWQLARAAEKERLLAEAATHRAHPPMPLGNFVASDGAALDGRSVELRGRYDPERSFLLDNKVLNGRVGYELLTPFVEQGGAVVIVDRGWLPAPRTRAELPAIETPQGELVVRGEFDVPADRRRLRLDAGAGWPRVVQALDVPALGRLAGVDAFPYVVRIGAAQPGAHESAHVDVNISPARHLAYAVQWFLMALALVIVFLLGGTNLRAWLRQRNDGDADRHES